MPPGSALRGAGAAGLGLALLALLLRDDGGGGAAALLRRTALLALCAACVIAGFDAGVAYAERCVWFFGVARRSAAAARRGLG
jgi:hypothetical protein